MKKTASIAHSAPQGSATPYRFAAYSLAAAGAAGVASTEAEAAVVYSGVQDLTINQYSSLNLDVNGDLTGDVTFKNYVFGGGNYQGASVNFLSGTIVGFNSGLSYVTALSANAVIDSTTAGPGFFGSMAYGAVNPSAQFNSATDAYVGLGFPVGPDLFYGWVRVTINNTTGSFTINDWAYESTPSVGIAAGAIPEPATASLLAALTVGGAAALRRRRREAIAA
jgi:hypothetical protein